MELYSIKVVVEIQKVKLSIRFPGQLSFQFKNNHLYEDISKMYQLVNGECNVEQSVAFEVQSTFNTFDQTYSDVMVDLIVSVNTSSGKIVAGVITFNAIQNITSTFPLKRCSDKTAEATISIAYARIKKLRDIQEQVASPKQKSQSRLLVNIRSIDKKSNDELRPPFLISDRKNIQRNQSKQSRVLLTSKVLKTIGADSRYRDMQENYEKKLKQLNKQKEQLQSNLENTRERCKISERREKELQTSNKDFKDIAEKRRNKISELQNKIGDYERLIQDYDKKLKLSQHQIKLSAEKIDDLTSKYLILERKIQNKEQSNGQRERRLSEKLQQLQSQHNKTVHEYSLLLQKMQLQQKANQTIYKNKQKGYLEQKLRWKEQFEKTDKNFNKLKQQYDDLLIKYNNLANSQKALLLKFNDLESQHEILKSTDQNRRISMEKEQHAKNELLLELETLKNIEADKMVLKKKMNEGSQQFLKLKQKFDKLHIENQQLKQNHKNLEKSSEQMKRQKRLLTTRVSDLQKSLVNTQKQLTKLQIQNNNILSKSTYLNQRMNDLRTKSEQQLSFYQENQSQLQSKISSLIQSKQYLETDIEDLKWSLQKSEESIYDCEKKIKQRNQDILKYQSQTLRLQKQNQNLVMRLQQARNDIDSLKAQASEYKRRENEFNDLLKDKDKKIYELTKKIAELDQDIFVNSSKFSNNIENIKQNLVGKELVIEQLKTEIAGKKLKLGRLQTSFQELEQSHQKQQRQIKLLMINLEESQRNLKLERQARQELKRQNNNLHKDLEANFEKQSEKERSYTDLTSDLKIKNQNLERQLKVSQTDVQTFKKAVQQFFMIVSKEDEVGKNEQIVAVPCQNLAKNQLEALLTRNKHINNFKSTISELQVEITYLKKQNEAKASALNSKCQQLQIITKQNSLKTQQAELSWRKQQEILNQKLQNAEVLLKTIRNDKQKLESKYKSVLEAYEEQKLNNRDLEDQLTAAKLQITKLQQLHLTLRSRQISKKGQDQSFIHNLKAELKAESNKYKQRILELTIEGEGYQKVIAQKQKNIANLKSNISLIQLQKNKIQGNLNDLNSKFSKSIQEKTQLDSKLTENQKKISLIQEKIQNLKRQVSSEKELREAVESKLKQAHHHAEELLINKENLENKLDNIIKASSTNQDDLRARVSQLEQNYNSESKKSGKLFKQLTEKSGQLQLKIFLIQQLQQKLNQNDLATNTLKKDLEQKRMTINKLNLNLQDQNRQYLAIEKEKSDYSQEKEALENELSLKKIKISQLQQEGKQLAHKIQILTHKLDDSYLKEADLTAQRNNLQTSLNQLRESLLQAKKEVQRSNAKQSESRNKLLLIQDQLKQKEQFYQNYKSKNWQQNQKQSHNLKQKVRQLESKIQLLQADRDNQREQMKTQLDYVSQSYQQLQLLLEEKEEIIQQQQNELHESQSRIINLNSQLRSCLEAWQKQKAASIPSRRQAAKIQEDISKFQSYAAQLDKKTQEIVNVSTFKIKDQIMARTAQSLVQLLELLHRSKSRALNRAADSQKGEIVKQYDRMREKIEDILKNQKITMASVNS